MCSRKRACWVLCLKIFICFLHILVEVSRDDLNRIFISFSGVSFNKLMHQNEYIAHSPVQFHLQRMSLETGTKVGLPQHGLQCIR